MVIWNEIRMETVAKIATVLDAIFMENKPVDKLLMDNSTALILGLLKGIDRWNIRHFLRIAYSLSENVIVEIHSHKIKATAEKE